MFVRKGDLVLVVAGKDKGKSGRVIRCLPKKEQVILERLNLVRRHLRPRTPGAAGGIVEKEAPLHVAKVRLICPRCEKATRVIYKRAQDGEKMRLCKRCQNEIRSE
jgi:large subunit ribosomal protein L24